jgi:hypothetical protein
VYLAKNPEVFDATPELGMGYHFGVVEGSNEGVIVLNAKYALTSKDIMNAQSLGQLLWTAARDADSGVKVTRTSAPPPMPERPIVPSEDVSLLRKHFASWVSKLNYYETRPTLHGSPPFPLLTQSAENFVRFSAFRNDRRVQSNGSLLAGTYVTSKRDANFSPSGCAAVGRYALPNMLPAVNRFDITVPAPTAGLVGTVASAFGQAGGGAEIEFTNATPAGSVTGPTTIAEY